MQTTHGAQTSNRLFEIVDDGIVFKPESNRDAKYGRLEIDNLSSDMDGMFPRQAEWTKFTNKVDNDGGSYILSYYLGGKKNLKGDIGYCMIERQNWYDDVCTLTFKEPIKMVVGGFRNKDGEWEHIIEEVDYLVGEIAYEWFYSKRLRTGRASSIEIYLNIKDYGKKIVQDVQSERTAVWLLEEYDQWFSSTSRVTLGVFTSKEKAIIRMKENYGDAELYECGTGQWKSDEKSLGIQICEVELDKFEEL